MTTDEFFASHPVFNLAEAQMQLAPPGGKAAVLERLKYAARTGRVKTVVRGVYAAVPRGIDPARFRPDPYLVAAAMRPDATFCQHSALELLGVAHSEWRQVTAYTGRRRQPLRLDDVELQFLAQPGPLLAKKAETLGVREVQRQEARLQVTSPERTLVEGFRKPQLAGGAVELVESAAGFSVLDMDLLQEILETYDERVLWAAVGWFLEAYRRRFFVSDEILLQFESRIPKSPQYLVPSTRGGTMVSRWNLIVPADLVGGREPDEV